MIGEGGFRSASTYALKPRFQNLLRPIARHLAPAGVRANQITVAAMLLSILVGVIAVSALPDPRGYALIAPWLLLRMALNALDGMLAREHAQESQLGFCLNELCDAGSDAALYLPFAFVPGFAPVLVAIVVVLALTSEYAGALALALGLPRRNDGPMGKSDRAFVFGALGLWVATGSIPAPWPGVLMTGVAAALLVTIAQRVRGALRRTR